MLFRKKSKAGVEKSDPIYHHDIIKPYYHSNIFFNGKYYHGTIKEGIAELCDDPVNPCRLSMLVKVKTKKLKTIRDGGDSEIIIIDGEILKDYTKL
jgi:hypothetical protein